MQHFETLTPRETQITQLVVDGLLNKQIAFELRLSENTVKNHLNRIFSKVGVGSRTSLAVSALRYGLVAPREEIRA